MINNEYNAEAINWEDLQGVEWGIPAGKQKRLDACGMLAWRIDHKTGRPYCTRFRCGDYRNCPICRMIYTQDKRKELKDFFISDRIFETVLDEKEGTKFARQLRDNGQLYCRIPMSDNQVRILFNGDIDETTGLREEGDHLIEELPLEVWLESVPEGKRLSKGGNRLGAIPQKKEDDQAYLEFDSFTLHTNASESETRAAFAEASQSCNIPLTYLDIPQCVNEKLRTTQKILERWGFVVYDVYLRDRVLVGLIPRWERVQKE